MPEKLKFYDLKGKKSFYSTSYKLVTKKGRRFAVAKNPSGSESWRIVGKKWLAFQKLKSFVKWNVPWLNIMAKRKVCK